MIWLSRSYEMKGDYSAAFEAFMKSKRIRNASRRIVRHTKPRPGKASS